MSLYDGYFRTRFLWYINYLSTPRYKKVKKNDVKN